MKKLGFILIILLATPPCFAATYTVDDNGPADFNTIQAAINFADDNDTIVVNDGTYSGGFQITKNLTLTSTDPNDPCIVADTIFYLNYFGEIKIDGYQHDINCVTINGFSITKGYVKCFNSSPIIENCVLRDVHPESSTGILFCEDSNPTIRKCTFINNSLRYPFPFPPQDWGHGGAIYAENSSLTIEDCNFIENSADMGGAIYTEDSSLYIDNCHFTRCTRTIYSYDADSVTINNCNFLENLGTISCYTPYSMIINNCTFVENSGSSIYCSHSHEPSINNCVFTGNNFTYNTADSEAHGSAIAFFNCNNTKINNCTFTENSVTNTKGFAKGGAIYCGENSITITNSTFNKNVSSGKNPLGGAVYCQESYSVFDNCIFNENSTITDVNTTIAGGGALDFFTDNGSIIRNCKFTANSGWAGGGIYCHQSFGIQLYNCVFSGNDALTNGGAINLYQYASAKIRNCTFTQNFASLKGGALSCKIGTISNSIFFDNHAEDGNEIALWGSTINIKHSNIKGGQAGIDNNDSTINWGPGNIDIDPCFVNPGYWDANGTPADANDDFWVDGDYHLNSAGWRWDSDANNWTWDDVTSRCIDAGNPGSPLGDEPLTLPVDPLNRWGQNLRIDMGAYGGTSEASMPPYDWAILSDIDNDGIVDFTDFAWLSGLWLQQDNEQFADFDRDGDINTPDLSLFTSDWLKTTTWH